MIVNFYLMRHGSHDGKSLTDKGRSQAIASAVEHLRDIPFCRAFSSGMQRATQTAEHALLAIGGHKHLEVAAESGFGYEFAEVLGAKELWPYEGGFQQALMQATQNGKTVTAGWVIQNWIPARIIRAGLSLTLRQWAERIAEEEWRRVAAGEPRRRVIVLVGTHNSAPLAAPDPEAITGNLENAGIIRYSLKVGGEREPTQIVGCQHLVAPKIE